MRTTFLFLCALLVAGCGSAATASKPSLDRDPRQPIATVRGSEPGTTLGLISLRRYGPKVVTAKVRVKSGAQADELDFGVDPLDWTVGGMRLVDEVNGREHFVLEDRDGECLCSTISGLEPGTQADLYAKFPAPPAGVTRVSLHVPNFPSFDNVRIAP